MPEFDRPLSILMTCHDRRQTTIACLEHLVASAPHPWAIHVFLTDDGCRDGTAQAVRRLLGRRLTVIQGDGQLYWNRGMLAAWRCALRFRPRACVLWLNDDVLLAPEALAHFATHAESCPMAVLAGQVADPGTGQVTYGGISLRRAAWRLEFAAQVNTGGTPIPCDTCNGNVILVPPTVSARLGLLDCGFRHAYGDYDYGLRAQRAGIPMLVLPGTVGACSRGERPFTWRNARLPRARRWRLAQAATGVPVVQQLRFHGRHGGPLRALGALTPYAKILFGR